MYFKNTRLAIILGLIVLSFIFLSQIPPSLLVDQNILTADEGKENVPELKEILSDNQEVRLKAARKLVERVDVEKALEILEHSTLPHTGEGHLVVHQVGFYAYQKYGADSILKCKDYFLYACYHGAIIEAASNQGFEAIAKMTDRCKASPLRYFQCSHAAGHAILAIWNYDLPQALTTCDSIFERETKFQDALSSCHNGAFMENLFGVHDWGTGKPTKRDWLSEDPYFPCNYFGEKYQKGCWLNQAARIYQMNKGNIPETAQICQQIGNNQQTTWCMDNLARQIHPLTNGDINKVFELCPQEGQEWINNCITVNALSYYSVGDPQSAIEICRRISPGGKQACYQNVVGQVRSDSLNVDKKRGLCSKMEEPFRSECSKLVLDKG
jgi:hypothetical protein